MSKLRAYIFLCCFFLAGQNLFAEERLLFQEAFIPFEPSSISAISKFSDGIVSTTQATAKPLGSSMLKENYIIGAVIDVPASVSKLEVLFVAKGADGQTKSVFASNLKTQELIPVANADQYFRDSIVSLNKEIDEMESEDVSIRNSVQELKQKVSDDQNLRKLTDVQDRYRRVEGQKAALERQVLHLEFLVAEAQSRELPYNFTKRELELTSQLSELAAAAKLVESKEVDDQNLTEDEILEMTSLVESVQGYHVEELEGRLRGLQQRVQAQ